MNIDTLMSRKVVTVELDDSLQTVKHIFEHVKFHHLLVVEQKKLVGLVSDRDLLKALSPYLDTNAETLRDKATLNKHVHQIMTRKPITLTAEANAFDAINLFNTERISCIPIVDATSKPVGIVSWRDIMLALGEMRSKQSDVAGMS